MDDIYDTVRSRYGMVARSKSSCCGPVSSGNEPAHNSCCSQTNTLYARQDIESIPADADMGLGCGNPTAFSSLQKGDVVLDLGSGGGIDCFLASKHVGQEGSVIGVDMTPDMISLARKNAREGNYSNVEFRLGEIENLPAADNSVDVVISNCVINLSPDKPRVFREIYRVLKKAGRMIVSDIVLLKPLPDFIRNDPDAYAACISGALLKEEYVNAIKSAGLRNLTIITEKQFVQWDETNDPLTSHIKANYGVTTEQGREFASSVVSIEVEAVK